MKRRADGTAQHCNLPSHLDDAGGTGRVWASKRRCFVDEGPLGGLYGGEFRDGPYSRTLLACPRSSPKRHWPCGLGPGRPAPTLTTSFT